MSENNKNLNGIVDGPHHFFSCSKCKAPLADIWVNHPDESMQWNFIAECPHCGDKSYKQTVYGSFFIGETVEIAKYTKVSDYDISTDPIIIKTVKVNNWKR